MSHRTLVAAVAASLLLSTPLLTAAAQCQQTPAPRQLSPRRGAILDNGCADQSDSTDWSFRWGRVAGAERYHLYVKSSGVKFPVIDAPNLSATSYIDRRPASYIANHNRTGWSWKVRAQVRGVWGPWSAERAFDVEPLDADCARGDGGSRLIPVVRTTGRGTGLVAPTQLYPADGAAFSHYPRQTVLVWSAVPGASSYTVEIDCFHCCQAGRWCTDVDGPRHLVPDLKTTVYSFNFVGSQPGRWRVWAVGPGGVGGPKTNWSQFTYAPIKQ